MTNMLLGQRCARAMIALAGVLAVAASGSPAYAAPRLYWSSGDDILSSRLDGSGTTTIATLSYRAPVSTHFVNELAVSRSSVFWANDRGGIGRMTRSGRSARLIAHSGASVSALTVHGRRLYWLSQDHNGRLRGLFTSGFSGRKQRTLVGKRALVSLLGRSGLTSRVWVWVTDRRLIWGVSSRSSAADAVRDRYRIDLVATDRHGRDRHVLGSLPTGHQDIYDIAIHGHSVFWARYHHHRIYRANLDGDHVRVLARTGRYKPFRLVTGGGRILWAAEGHPFFNSDVWSARPNGADVRVVQRRAGRPGKPGVSALAVGPVHR